MQYLHQLAQQRWPWLLLAFSALCLELSALFFQHVMMLEPCVMCIYERIAMLGVIAAGLIGAINPQFWLTRWLGFASWITAGIWGLLLAIEHVDYQLNPSPFYTCDFVPNFPQWLPLHQWVPWLFNPNGDCGEIVWQFLGYSMPQWLIVCFAIYIVIFAVVIVGQLAPLFKRR
ncbi:disulfide bond formation protein DsbB [Motilimonas pumila]|uniref:Disulfide bond formation protein B n=1 Tax=Motilimonas pumila TaxID=2303987 RepID=A0A418YDF1_9GAMM|nr:disulfide bond formation protein DsbB [Motilimonas pumila]RJG42558.1 disulfide bond formation protein DsbB [Motilimonas pumila]